jgi:hypothetical protein
VDGQPDRVDRAFLTFRTSRHRLSAKRSTARDEGMLIVTRRFRKFSRERLLVLVAFIVLLFLGFYFGVLRVAPPLHSAG